MLQLRLLEPYVKLPLGVTIIISINIFVHKQHTLCEQFYGVDGSCHVIKLLAKRVLVVTVDIDTAYDYSVSEFCSFSNFSKSVTLFLETEFVSVFSWSFCYGVAIPV